MTIISSDSVAEAIKAFATSETGKAVIISLSGVLIGAGLAWGTYRTGLFHTLSRVQIRSPFHIADLSPVIDPDVIIVLADAASATTTSA